MTEYEINAKDYQVEYDLDNRITKVDVDNNDVEYRYDAFGRRVIRKQGTTTTSLIWCGNSEKYRRLVGILDKCVTNYPEGVSSREAAANQCAEHKHQDGQNDIFEHPSRLNSVIARAIDGSKFKLQWYHKNYLDHVYGVSDDSGAILEHYRYTAFGEATIYNENGNLQNTTQIDNHILWNTRRRDEVTGYYMYKFRHYSAELGRWPSRDPIEENGGVNLYAFVGNNGINEWDRLGLDPLGDLIWKHYVAGFFGFFLGLQIDHLNHDDGEMNTLANLTLDDMDLFYSFKARQANVEKGKWTKVDIGLEPTGKDFNISTAGWVSDAGFWLGTAKQTVAHAGSSIEVCKKEDGSYLIKNSKVQYHWYDSIDSNPNEWNDYYWLEWMWQFPEAVMSLDFDVYIKFADNRPEVRELR